jgi:CBS domain-containing protein
VWQLMVPDPVTVPANATVEQLMTDVFLPTQHTAFPVVDDGRAAGIVSFRDVLALPRAAWATTPVREIMVSAERACVDPAASLADTLPRLAAGYHHRLLVCRNGRLYVLPSLADVMRARSRLGQPALTEGRVDRRGKGLVAQP